METGNLKAIVHIVTVATDKDPLIHLMAINSGGSVLYLYIHQVSQEKVQLNSSIKTFPRFSPKPPALKPLRTRLPPVRRLLPFGAALAAVHVADAAVLPNGSCGKEKARMKLTTLLLKGRASTIDDFENKMKFLTVAVIMIKVTIVMY